MTPTRDGDPDSPAPSREAVPDAAHPSSATALYDGRYSFADLADVMPHIVWSARADGHVDYYNAQWYAFTGAPHGSTDGEAWAGMFHPDDQPGTWARWRHSLATGDPYEVEYRLRHHSGSYHWVLGRGRPVRDADGAVVRWIGTCTDIDDAKLNAQRAEVTARELNHRIKNLFAIISGLVGLSARHAPEARPFADQLRGRIAALGRAHDFVRPRDTALYRHERSSLHHILAELLGPYPAFAEGRITIAGDDVPIDDRGATPIALIIHELATNATKYGAISTDAGQVAITATREGDALVLRWDEAGRPVFAGPAGPGGFGGRLIDVSIVQQLGGRFSRTWRDDGMTLEMRVQLDRLCRPSGLAE